MSWHAKLDEMGVALPTVAAPLANYVPAVQSGNMVFTSGQLPFEDGALVATGKVGTDVDVETAERAARASALNALAAIESLVGLEAIERVVKVVGFVNSAPGFTNQAAVMNGASNLIGEIFGSAGVHARSAVGVAELPINAAVEVELIVQIR